MPSQYKRVEGVAVVTGAGSGIGRAVAKGLLVAGISKIYLADIRNAGLDETKSILEKLDVEPRPEIILEQLDVTCPLNIQKFFANIQRLDYAVNCAGILGASKPSTEVSLAEFDNLNDVNYRGVWMCQKEEIRVMLNNDIRPYNGSSVESDQESKLRGQRGSIVNIASQLGIVGKAHAATYTASKAAVLALTRSDSLDFSKPPHHIRINAICPGVISTPMTTSETGEVDEKMQDAVKIAPMARMGLPSEIADAAVFLCSGESSFITGSSMVVDGGYITS